MSVLRPARPDDVPAVLSLIRALARYEKLEHEVVGTEAELREHLFGAHPRAEVVLVEETLRGAGSTTPLVEETRKEAPLRGAGSTTPLVEETRKEAPLRGAGSTTPLDEEAGQIVAFALFFHNYSTFLCKPGLYLEDLFVAPEHRGKGLGRALLAHLAQLAVARGCGRMEWAVLDWNEPAIGFYRALGARSLDDWRVFRLTGDALEKLGRSLG